jgi:hypothetical protein
MVWGSNPGGGETVRIRPDGSGAHPAPRKIGTGSLLWVKRPGRGINYPPPSSTEGKQRLELYFHSPSVSSWHALGEFYLLGGAEKFLARSNSRCRRTESILSLEIEVCLCA